MTAGTYTAYFGFRELPFSITPDPRFLYYNDCYHEAVAALGYGIEARKGFVSLIGEAGTGKTTLLRNALDTLDPQVRTVLLLHPTVTFDEILEHFLQELGIPTEGARKLVRLQRLNEFLLEHTRSGGNVALLVDEAQDLSPSVLEELRLLSNLETGREKILQIVLAGQPELESHLSNPALRQLRQRIALHIRIRPLSVVEVGAYVRSRIERAGGPGKNLFHDDAIEKIAAASHGIPRIVNVLCDAALMSAVAQGARQVTGPMIDEVWTDHGGYAGPLEPITIMDSAVRPGDAPGTGAWEPLHLQSSAPLEPPLPLLNLALPPEPTQRSWRFTRGRIWSIVGALAAIGAVVTGLSLRGRGSHQDNDGVWPEDVRQEAPSAAVAAAPTPTVPAPPPAPAPVSETAPPAVATVEPLGGSSPPVASPETVPAEQPATVEVVPPRPRGSAPNGVEAVHVVEAFRSAYEGRDLSRLADLLTTDVRSGRSRGRDAVAAAYRDTFSDWAEIELSMPTLRVLPRGNRTAVDGPYTTRFRRKNGTRGSRKGWTEFLIVRSDDGVRIAAIASREGASGPWRGRVDEATEQTPDQAASPPDNKDN
jgi:general secretion pathway protein A